MPDEQHAEPCIDEEHQEGPGHGSNGEDADIQVVEFHPAVGAEIGAVEDPVRKDHHVEAADQDPAKKIRQAGQIAHFGPAGPGFASHHPEIVGRQQKKYDQGKDIENAFQKGIRDEQVDQLQRNPDLDIFDKRGPEPCPRPGCKTFPDGRFRHRHIDYAKRDRSDETQSDAVKCDEE